MKQENRTLTSVSSYTQSSGLPPRRQGAPLKSIPEKKPPLGPPKPRLPLRRITNFVPDPSPSASRSTPTFRGGPSGSAADKENQVRAAAAKSSFLRMPRRISIIKPHPDATTTNKLPRRRISIATLRPEPSLHATTTTPLPLRNGNGSSRQSFARDNQKGRYSQLFSFSRPDTSLDVGTPVGTRISTKFMGSPISQQVVGSWKPRHPTVVALQQKTLVWSPLKIRSLKKNATRSSLVPIRSKFH